MTIRLRLPAVLLLSGLVLAGCSDVLEDFPDTSVATMRMSSDSLDLVIGSQAPSGRAGSSAGVPPTWPSPRWTTAGGSRG